MVTEAPPAADADDPLGLVARSHPIRAILSQEMHLRRLPRFAAPARFLQVVLLSGEPGFASTSAQVAALQPPDAPPLLPGARHARFALGPLHVVWERHAEFETYGFLLTGAFDAAFDMEAFAPARAIIAAMPVAVVRATFVALFPPSDKARCAALAASLFSDEGLVVCDVVGGKARLWSDFRLGEGGLGRLLIADRGLAGDEPAQLVQRVQELGNYRNMALLGLPVAQRLTPELRRLDERLAALTASVAEPTAPDESLLDELTLLSAELARLLAETRYRMSATQAYATIVEERLEALDVAALPGRQTLAEFTDRRLMPAVRTCASVSQRLEDLSQRAAWTSSLLRTRTDTALARQNRDLLESMNRGTRLQLRLQQAVEGLSVVAISYYLVALLDHVLQPVRAIHQELVMALLTPAVVILVAWQLSRLRRRLIHGQPEHDDRSVGRESAPDRAGDR